MPGLYPEIEPYKYGMLDLGDGSLVYWEECGNPEGKPVIVLHGGPGSGCNAGMRREPCPSVNAAVHPTLWEHPVLGGCLVFWRVTQAPISRIGGWTDEI